MICITNERYEANHGRVQTFKCLTCKYELKYVLGVGKLYTPEQLFSQEKKPLIDQLVRSNETKKTLKEWVHVHHAKICDGYTRVLYVYLSCDRTFNRFHTQLENNGEFIELEYECDTCKVKLVQLKDEESEVRNDLEVDKFINSGCPQGGEKLLVEMMFERWE